MDLSKLPENLPPPIDDGAAAHLDLKILPNLLLLATNNETVCISDISGLLSISAKQNNDCISRLNC